ncbi:hypothetical protein F5Y17DRAFT_451037, partial [Xylariaceae sp. FL0594]
MKFLLLTILSLLGMAFAAPVSTSDVSIAQTQALGKIDRLFEVYYPGGNDTHILIIRWRRRGGLPRRILQEVYGLLLRCASKTFL